jgi:hypothetical protein
MGTSSKSPPEFGQRQPPPQGMAGLGAAAARMMGRNQNQPAGPQEEVAQSPPPPLPSQKETPQGMAGLGAAMAMALRKFQG